jgi:hypothetical protein
MAPHHDTRCIGPSTVGYILSPEELVFVMEAEVKCHRM